MAQTPTVSIITPSFNQAPYLEETILSVLGQSYPNIEYSIIDGGSTDDSVSIIKKYEKKLKNWISENDKGQTDAINKGFAMAKGEILGWINSDDTLQPNAVEDAVAFLNENPQIALVYGDANYINGQSKVIGRFPAAQTSYSQLRRGYVHIPQQASFFRKEIWNAVGPLDPDFYFAMDYDLWVRIAREAPIRYIQKTWANFRLHEDAKTISADERCWPEMLKIHYRNGGSVFSMIVLKNLVRKLAAPYIRWKRKRLINQ